MTNDPLGTENEQFSKPTKKPVILKRRPTWVTGKILDDWLMNDSDHLPEDLKSGVELENVNSEWYDDNGDIKHD